MVKKFIFEKSGVEKSRVEKSGVEKFMIEKFGIEKSRVKRVLLGFGVQNVMQSHNQSPTKMLFYYRDTPVSAVFGP